MFRLAFTFNFSFLCQLSIVSGVISKDWTSIHLVSPIWCHLLFAYSSSTKRHLGICICLSVLHPESSRAIGQPDGFFFPGLNTRRNNQPVSTILDSRSRFRSKPRIWIHVPRPTSRSRNTYHVSAVFRFRNFAFHVRRRLIGFVGLFLALTSQLKLASQLQ